MSVASSRRTDSRPRGGVDLERDVLAKMGFRPKIAADLREMDATIFTHAPPASVAAR